MKVYITKSSIPAAYFLIQIIYNVLVAWINLAKECFGQHKRMLVRFTTVLIATSCGYNRKLSRMTCMTNIPQMKMVIFILVHSIDIRLFIFKSDIPFVYV